MTVTRLNNNIKTNSTERLIEEEVIKLQPLSANPQLGEGKMFYDKIAKALMMDKGNGLFENAAPPVKVFYDNSVSLTTTSSAEVTKNTVTIPAGTFKGNVTLVIKGAVQFYQTSASTTTKTTTSKLKINGSIKMTNLKNSPQSSTDDDLVYSRLTDVLTWTEIGVSNISDIVITITGQWNYSSASWQIQGVPCSVIAIQE